MALRACVALLLATAVWAPLAEAAQDRVLLVTEARGFVHDSIPAAEDFFVGLGERSARYDVVALRGGAAGLTGRRLRRAAAVVFANTSGELPLPDRPAFRRFVRRGGAFLGTHSASDTLHGWPAFEGLLGGEFERHGAVQPGRLLVARRQHPVTSGLPRSFTLTDEFYEFRVPVPPGTRVLVRVDPESLADEEAPELPVVWARRYGQGRVFYSALGHPQSAWQHPLHRRILRRGLAWAIGQR
jgi:type 1 glutamine amidotransferase